MRQLSFSTSFIAAFFFIMWSCALPYAKTDFVPAQPDTKTVIAVFPFELKDFSGGASIIPESSEDKKYLSLATDAARQLIEASGRYRLVDTSSVGSQPAKAHSLLDCDGCDAAIALGLGAEQSLVGIVTRITRTDYAVTFKLRDARTGKLLSVEQTDLRIGANYSWDRGAAWLIKHRLLEKQNRPKE